MNFDKTKLIFKDYNNSDIYSFEYYNSAYILYENTPELDSRRLIDTICFNIETRQVVAFKDMPLSDLIKIVTDSNKIDSNYFADNISEAFKNYLADTTEAIIDYDKQFFVSKAKIRGANYEI